MADYYAQKIEYKNLVQESTELGLQWSFSKISSINLKDIRQHLKHIIISTDNYASGQQEKDQKILHFIKRICPKVDKFQWTPKHHLCKTINNTWENKCQIEREGGTITIIAYHQQLGWSVTSLSNPVEVDQSTGHPISGITCLQKLRKAIPEINDWKNDEYEGLEYKKKIKNFYDEDREECFKKVCNDLAVGQTLENVCSLDCNSDYPYELTKLIPSAYTYEYNLFIHRKENAWNKAILNYPIGAMQSIKTERMIGINTPFAFTKLAYNILLGASTKLRKLAKELEDQGAIILMFSIDSIKFIWNKKYPPRGLDIGSGFGQWKWEFYKSPKFRMLSKNKYQYIGTEGKDEGVHHVVLSGLCKMDRIKPDRTTWDWDDLLKSGEPHGWSLDIETFNIIWEGDIVEQEN